MRLREFGNTRNRRRDVALRPRFIHPWPGGARRGLDNSGKSLNIRFVARVVLEHLAKDFCGSNGDRVCALAGVNLEIRDREWMTLIGASGCGKTTLLRLMAGLETPTAGLVRIDGVPVADLAPKARDVAMVFQQPALYPHLTVYENLAFGLRLRGHGRAEIRQRVDEVASLLGLETCLDRRPMHISGGQRQRVALGRALARRPKLFLFDEPFSHLDAPLREQLRAELARLHQQLQFTMVYVTHDPQEAMSLGQRVAVMEAGTLLQVATPEQLYRQPAHLRVAEQIGWPRMALLQGKLMSHEHVVCFQPQGHGGTPGPALRLDNVSTERLAERLGQGVTLGIRPDQVSVRTSAAAEPAGQWIPGTVEGIESIWPGWQARVAVPGGTLTWRLPSGETAMVGQAVDVMLDLRQAHFFGADGRVW